MNQIITLRLQKGWIFQINQRSYFNNHYGAKAVVNALQFKEVLGQKLTAEQEKALTHAQNYITQISQGSKLDHYIKG